MITSVVRKKGKGEKRARLSERDFKVFKFLMEMKFANVVQIFEMFFRSAKSQNPKYCANRLSLLKRSGYLQVHSAYDGPTKYYTATKKAYAILMSEGLEDDQLPSAKEGMDHRFFIHDKNLVWLRIYLKKLGIGFNWISERSIRRKLFLDLSAKERTERNPLAEQLIPDAIFENKNGERIFVELEHSMKDGVHYENKLSRYRVRIDNKNHILSGDKVLYICTKPSITKRLNKMVKSFSFASALPFEEFEQGFLKRITE